MFGLHQYSITIFELIFDEGARPAFESLKLEVILRIYWLGVWGFR